MKGLRKIVALLSLSLLLNGMTVNAYTTKYQYVDMGNGNAVSYYNKKSNVLWLGDSRMVQMYNYKHKQSFVAVWGGAYMSDWGGQRLRIDSKTRTKDIKKILTKMLKKYGKAYCVLVPTINDYSKGNHYKGALSRYMKLYKKIKKWSKDITILSPSLVKLRNGYSCVKFNKALKKKVEQYISLDIPTKYYSDRAHYNDLGLKYIYKTVNKYVEA